MLSARFTGEAGVHGRKTDTRPLESGYVFADRWFGVSADVNALRAGTRAADELGGESALLVAWMATNGLPDDALAERIAAALRRGVPARTRVHVVIEAETALARTAFSAVWRAVATMSRTHLALRLHATCADALRAITEPDVDAWSISDQ